MKIIEVDLTLCEGHGKCYRLAPEMMEPIDDHGHAGWCGTPISDSDTAAIKLAETVIAECPESALSWKSSEED